MVVAWLAIRGSVFGPGLAHDLASSLEAFRFFVKVSTVRFSRPVRFVQFLKVINDGLIAPPPLPT